MKLNWNFQRGGGVIGQIPSVRGGGGGGGGGGRVWIFSGTTQFTFSMSFSLQMACLAGPFAYQASTEEKFLVSHSFM